MLNLLKIKPAFHFGHPSWKRTAQDRNFWQNFPTYTTSLLCQLPKPVFNASSTYTDQCYNEIIGVSIRVARSRRGTHGNNNECVYSCNYAFDATVMCNMLSCDRVHSKLDRLASVASRLMCLLTEKCQSTRLLTMRTTQINIYATDLYNDFPRVQVSQVKDLEVKVTLITRIAIVSQTFPYYRGRC